MPMIRTSRLRENAVDRTQIERFLAESLADRKLSGSEKQTLAGWVADHAKNDQQKGPGEFHRGLVISSVWRQTSL